MIIQKDKGVESIRGIAIILIVAAHVIGGDAGRGMKVGDDSVWRYLYDSFRFIRVPLFTIISGYVYSLRPVKKGFGRLFIKGKFRRLLFPFLMVSTVQFLIKSIVPWVNKSVSIKSIWKIYIFPFDQFWFLQSLFLVFIVVLIIELSVGLRSLHSWSVHMLISSCLFVFSGAITPFMGISGAAYLFIFFLFGVGLQRFEYIAKSSKVLIISLLILFSGVAMIQLTIAGILIIENDILKLIELFSSLALGFLIFRFRNGNQLLIYLGSFAFPIYLFHVIFLAGIRIAFNIIGLYQNSLLFFTSLCGAIILSIVATIVLRKIQITRRIFLGEK